MTYKVCTISDVDKAYRHLAKHESRTFGVDQTPHASRLVSIIEQTEQRTGRPVRGYIHMKLFRKLYANRPEEYEKRYGIPYVPVD